jgi:hypothetical protein
MVDTFIACRLKGEELLQLHKKELELGVFEATQHIE